MRLSGKDWLKCKYINIGVHTHYTTSSESELGWGYWLGLG